MIADRTPARSLSLRGLILTGIAVGAILIAAAAVWVLVEFRFEGRNKAVRAWEVRLEALGDGRKRAIQTWLAERRADTELLAWDPDLIHLCAAGTCPKGYDPGMLTTHLDNLRRFAGFLGAYIFTPDGNVLLGAGDGREPSGEAGAVARRVAREARYLLHDVHRAEDGTPMIGFLAPVFAQGGPAADADRGPVLGVVGLYLDPRDTLYSLVRAPETRGSPASVFLVRRIEDRAQVFAPLPDNGAQLPQVPLGESRAAEVAALDTKESVGWFRDHRGKQVMAALRWISEAGWGLVVEVAEAEALAGWRQEVRREAGFLVVGVACLCLAGVAGWRTWAGRRYRALLDEIRIREERLRALAQGSDDVVFVKDLDGRFLIANPTACRVLGASAERVVGTRTADHLPPEVAGELERHDREAVERGRPFHGEEMIPVDGEERTFLAARVPLRDAAGQVSGVAGVLRDITGRKRSERALVAEANNRRRAEERLRRLHEATAGLTGERLFQAVVAALAQELGVRWAVVVRVGSDGAAAPLAAVDDGRPAAFAPFALEGTLCEKVVSSGAPVFDEAAAKHLPGDAFCREHGVASCVGVPLTDSRGQVVGVLCAFHDRELDLGAADRDLLDLYGRRVSGEVERIIAEQRLAEARRTLETLIRNLPGAVYRCRAAGNRPVEYISEGCEALSGYRPEDFGEERALGLSDLVVPEDQAEIRREVDRAEAGRPWEMEYRIHDARGAVRWVYDVGRAVRDSETGEISLEGVLFDHTEKRSLEAQLTHSQRMEALGRLAGGVAHDFNNLLTAITGYAEMLLMRLSEEERSRTAAQAIVRAADRGAGLTRQLLAFSRRQVVEPKIVDFSEAVRGAVAMVERILGEDVELDLRLSPQAGRVRADPSQLEQVVLNLAVNARDAMPSGGRLTVETRLAAAGEDPDAPPDLPPGRYTLLRVADTGSGIDPSLLEHIFEPFYTTKGEGEATGLGLASVYGIVRQAGGQVRVGSEPGRGSAFRVYWPCWEPTTGAEPERGRGEAVMVVEDEDDVRGVVAEHLREQGYSVSAFAVPQEALDAVAAGLAVDVVVSDVVMPRMNGPELVRRLREGRPGLPAVLLSGHAGRAVAEIVDRSDEWEFLQKPFHLADLARAVGRALSRVS